MNAIVASPCSHPGMTLEEILAAYAGIGFRQLELFTGWVRSAVDWKQLPEIYLQLARAYDFRFASFHLPPITMDLGTTLERAVDAARFAHDLGVEVVLFKATSREIYIRAARPFLDLIQYLQVIPVLQNHAGSPISTLRDYREVIEGIDDHRMKTLLEVGHFHTVGVSWREGVELLGDSIALVHIKDQIGNRSVPFGTGEIDLQGLFAHMKKMGYTGRYVVEMEVADKENTLHYLQEALHYIEPWIGETGTWTD